MIELNSIVVILMAEALAAVLLIMMFFFFRSKKNVSGEQLAAHELIDKLEDTESFKSKKLAKLISEHCAIEQGDLKNILKDINQNERILYQKIIQVFLNNDTGLLKGIDKQVDKLAEPYCKLLVNNSSNNVGDEKLNDAEKMLSLHSKENERLSEQLKIAMQTMDEISQEYTKVFAGNQTQLELENSSKKMFAVFRDAEQRIRESNKTMEVS